MLLGESRNQIPRVKTRRLSKMARFQKIKLEEMDSNLNKTNVQKDIKEKRKEERTLAFKHEVFCCCCCCCFLIKIHDQYSKV